MSTEVSLCRRDHRPSDLWPFSPGFVANGQQRGSSCGSGELGAAPRGIARSALSTEGVCEGPSARAPGPHACPSRVPPEVPEDVRRGRAPGPLGVRARRLPASRSRSAGRRRDWSRVISRLGVADLGPPSLRARARHRPRSRPRESQAARRHARASARPRVKAARSPNAVDLRGADSEDEARARAVPGALPCRPAGARYRHGEGNLHVQEVAQQRRRKKRHRRRGPRLRRGTPGSPTTATRSPVPKWAPRRRGRRSAGHQREPASGCCPVQRAQPRPAARQTASAPAAGPFGPT